MINNLKFTNINDLIINENYLKVFQDNNLLCLNDLINFNGGEVFRKNNLRSVVRFEFNEKDGKKHIFHMKRHKLNFKERFKALFNKGVAADGENEWKKIIELHNYNINTMIPVAFGIKKKKCLPFVSLTITEHLYNTIRLEDFIKENFKVPLSPLNKILKKKIISELALLCRSFHEKGFCHKDFYLGHFFIRNNPVSLYLIDLQRVTKNKKICYYDRIKDISQLYYSSTLLNEITIKDRISFFKQYLNKGKFELTDKTFLKKVIKKSNKISRHTDKMLKIGGWK